jgi:hypothetical protein
VSGVQALACFINRSLRAQAKAWTPDLSALPFIPITSRRQYREWPGRDVPKEPKNKDEPPQRPASPGGHRDIRKGILRADQFSRDDIGQNQEQADRDEDHGIKPYRLPHAQMKERMHGAGPTTSGTIVPGHSPEMTAAEDAGDAGIRAEEIDRSHQGRNDQGD